jgi:multicomponent Na+:H+ antiporter subunit F
MNSFLLGITGFVLFTVALGLIRILRGPGNTERMMAAQLLGTGGVAVLLLLAVLSGVDAILDVALVLALLAAFASVAFFKAASQKSAQDSAGDTASQPGQHSGQATGERP